MLYNQNIYGKNFLRFKKKTILQKERFNSYEFEIKNNIFLSNFQILLYFYISAYNFNEVIILIISIENILSYNLENLI